MNPTLFISGPSIQSRRRLQGGFSLVELLVSAAILAVTVSGFYLTFGGANELATRARLNTSAKILLGAAVNEAISSRWSSTFVPEVAQPADDVPYDTKNEGQNATPTARGPGVVSLFSSPTDETVVTGIMRRTTTSYTEASGTARLDMRKVTFRVQYTYRGVTSPWIEIQTVITRD